MKTHQLRLLLLLPALSAGVAVVHASQHIFSVHDDLLAYPQYKIVFSDTAILEADAQKRIASQSTGAAPDDAASAEVETSSHLSALPTKQDTTPPLLPDASTTTSVASHPTYELLRLRNYRYLCTIPHITAPLKNATAEALARASEEKELAAASIRGPKLLEGMRGTCLYYLYDWWSYKFCYDAGVKQYHALPPQQGVVTWPPVEDQNVPAYILGRVVPSSSSSSSSSPSSDSSLGADKHPERAGTDNRNQNAEVEKAKRSGNGQEEKGGKEEKMEVASRGDQRYLVQKLGAGTICDLTGKERRIAIEYHCHSQSTADRIAWVKEVTTCSYLMVVYTPRLCTDPAFLPPKGTGANVSCQRILQSEEEVKEWRVNQEREMERVRLKDEEEEDDDEEEQEAQVKRKQNSSKEKKKRKKLIIGGVEVGGRSFFNGRDDTRRIDVGNSPESSNSNSNSNANSNANGGNGKNSAAGDGSGSGSGSGSGGVGKGGDGEGGSQRKTKAKEEENDIEHALEAVRKFKKELEDLASHTGWKVEVVRRDDADDTRANGGHQDGDDTFAKKKKTKKRKGQKVGDRDDDDGGSGGRESGSDAVVDGRKDDGEHEEDEQRESSKGSEEVYIVLDDL